ncbi:MAG: TolB family protein [Janthinobacterium lividum]
MPTSWFLRNAHSSSISLCLALSFAAGAFAQTPAAVTSTLNTLDLTPGAQPVAVYTHSGYFEAPNWTRDGNSLVFDADGQVLTIANRSGAQPTPLPLGDLLGCGGSHGLSPEGHTLAVTCHTAASPDTRVYLVPFPTGGAPRPLTHLPASYFHSWSPDGQTIFFTHPDRGAGNIFSVHLDGSDEHAITTGSGISDDPDISPDGRVLYFNADRSGSMQIWHMHPDGTRPEQLTNDSRVNWSPHPSPDGRFVVFLSYEPGTTGHPANRSVTLRLLTLANGQTRTLVSFTGGSGSINVPSWSPDSQHLAYVSYALK